MITKGLAMQNYKPAGYEKVILNKFIENNLEI